MLQSCPARFKNLYSRKGFFSLQNRSWSKTPQKSRPSSHIFHPLANLCRRVSDPLWREFCDAMRLAVILTLALLVQAKDITMRTYWHRTWRTKALKEGLPSCHQCNNKIVKSHILDLVVPVKGRISPLHPVVSPWLGCHLHLIHCKQSNFKLLKTDILTETLEHCNPI